MGLYILMFSSFACSQLPLSEVVNIECRWVEFDVTDHKELLADLKAKIDAAHRRGDQPDFRLHEQFLKAIARHTKPLEECEVIASVHCGKPTNVRLKSPGAAMACRLEALSAGKGEFHINVRPEITRESNGGRQQRTTDMGYSVTRGETARLVIYLGSQEFASTKNGKAVSRTRVSFISTSASAGE